MNTLKMMSGGGMNSAQELAEMLRQMGRGNDTVLAHITPQEAELLLRMGGSGTINPNTGLPEFQDEDIYDLDIPGAGGTVAEQQAQIQAGYYDPSTYTGSQYSSGGGAQVFPVETPQIQSTPIGQPSFVPQSVSADLPRSFLPPDALQEMATAEQFAAEPSDGRSFETGSAIERQLQGLEGRLRRNPLATQLGVGLAQALLARQDAKPLKAQSRLLQEQAARTRAMATEAQARAAGGGLTAAEQRALQIAQARARAALGSRGMGEGSAAAGILSSQEQRQRAIAKEEALREYATLMGIADQSTLQAAQLDLQRNQYLGNLAAQVLAGIVTRPQQPAPPKG